MIREAAQHSILGRAQTSDRVSIDVHDLRDYTVDKRRTVDDTPYGGGAGMVLKPEPIFDAVESVLRDAQPGYRIVLMTPQGKPLTQKLVRELAQADRLVLICGHYEGFDERIREHLATDEISIGDYVLTGGELPALVLIDAIIRLQPGVLGNEGSPEDESFEDGLLEYPQYTRPLAYRGWTTPDVLLSGHHAQIAEWRMKQRVERTKKRRPDLWRKRLAAERKLRQSNEQSGQ